MHLEQKRLVVQQLTDIPQSRRRFLTPHYLASQSLGVARSIAPVASQLGQLGQSLLASIGPRVRYCSLKCVATCSRLDRFEKMP